MCFVVLSGDGCYACLMCFVVLPGDEGRGSTAASRSSVGSSYKVGTIKYHCYSQLRTAHGFFGMYYTYMYMVLISTCRTKNGAIR